MSRPDRQSRPGDESQAAQVSIDGDPQTVHRSAVEALLETLSADLPTPLWRTHPSNEVQFAAALLASCPNVTPVYDADGVLVWFRGIRLRRSAA